MPYAYFINDSLKTYELVETTNNGAGIFYRFNRITECYINFPNFRLEPIVIPAPKFKVSKQQRTEELKKMTWEKILDLAFEYKISHTVVVHDMINEILICEGYSK